MRIAKTTTSLLGGLIFLWGTAGLVGCATKPPSIQEQAYNDYKRADAAQILVEEFNDKKRRCQRRGGYMILTMGAGGKVDRRTMELAYCEYGSRALFEGFGT